MYENHYCFCLTTVVTFTLCKSNNYYETRVVIFFSNNIVVIIKIITFIMDIDIFRVYYEKNIYYCRKCWHLHYYYAVINKINLIILIGMKNVGSNTFVLVSIDYQY